MSDRLVFFFIFFHRHCDRRPHTIRFGPVINDKQLLQYRTVVDFQSSQIVLFNCRKSQIYISNVVCISETAASSERTDFKTREISCADDISLLLF